MWLEDEDDEYEDPFIHGIVVIHIDQMMKLGEQMMIHMIPYYAMGKCFLGLFS